MPTGLAFDPDHAVSALSTADRRLAKLIERVGPFALRTEKIGSPFEALAKAIVYQQLSGKAAATIFGRARDSLPAKRWRPQAVLSTPATALRAAGLSTAKVAAVRDLAEKTISGVVPPLAKLRQLSDEEVIARLIAVRGIGVWTAEMLLIFRLGRPDVLPLADLGVRKGYMLAFGARELPAPAEVARRGERWRPYRSVASWYLWRAVDLAAGRWPASKDGSVGGSK